MKKKLIVLAAFGLALAACTPTTTAGSSSTGNSSESPAASSSSSQTASSSSSTVAVAISIDGAETVVAGEAITLTATVTGSTDVAVTWESADTAVATVAAGVVTGVKAGTVVITATSHADPSKKATKSITVTAPAVVVSVDGAATVDAEATITLTATVANATDTSVTWTSSDATVATVAAGVVTGIKAGKTTIRATSVADPTKYAEKEITVVVTADQLGTKILYADEITGASEKTITTKAADEGAHYYFKLTAAAADVYYVALSDSVLATGDAFGKVENDTVIYDSTGAAVSVSSLSQSETLTSTVKAWSSEHIVALNMAANDVFYIAVSPAYDSATSFGYGTTKMTVSTVTGDRPEEAVDYVFGTTQEFNIVHDVQRQMYKIHLAAGTYKWTGVLKTFFYADIYNAADLSTKVASYLRTDASFITIATEGDYIIVVNGYTNSGVADSFTIADTAEGEVPAKAIALTFGTGVKVGKGGGYTYYSASFTANHTYRFDLKNPSDSGKAGYYVFGSIADAIDGSSSKTVLKDEEEYSWGSYETGALTDKYTPTEDMNVIIKAGYSKSSSSLTAFDFMVSEVLPGSSLDSAIVTTGGTINPGTAGKYYSYTATGDTSFYNVTATGATGTTTVSIYAGASTYAKTSGTGQAGFVFGKGTTYYFFVKDTVDEDVTLAVSADAGVAFADGGTATIPSCGYVVRKFTVASSNFYDIKISGATGSPKADFWDGTSASDYSAFNAAVDTTTNVMTVSAKKISSGSIYWVVISGTANDALTFAISGVTATATAPTVEGTATTATGTIAKSYGDAYMMITLVSGKYYSFAASSASTNGKVGLLAPDMSTAASDETSFTYKPTADGVYFLHFYSSSAEDVVVTMNISATAPEDGKSADTAWTVTEGTGLTKALSSGSTYYFKVVATKTGTYTIASSSTGGDPDLSSVKTADGTSLGVSASNSGDFSVTASFTAGVTYVIAVRQYGSDANVTVTVTAPNA